MKKVLNYHIPVYGVLALVIGVAGIFLFLFMARHPEVSYNYQVLVPEAGATEQTLQYGSWPAMAEADFFGKVRDRFVEERASFIEADLSEMRLRVYLEGTIAKEAPILTKGREGSWWETPAGVYRVEGKIRNHFSGFAKVYLPWSLPFQGNFFIHGWPYYPDGTPVETKYSGGCIRLSTADAEEVFRLAKVGMPVLVFKKELEKDDYAYKLKAPDVGAPNYLIADLKSNYAFAERDADKPVPIASLTKLMTALVAVEYVNIEKTITVDKRMLVATSLPRLKAGTTYSLYNLLLPLLMESSNEAAEAISYYVGPQRFVELMNQKAKAIGMTHTVFTDASGRGPGNTSTAHDLFALSKYLSTNRSFILKMTAGKTEDSVYGAPAISNLQNFNVLHDAPDYAGGKVGMSNDSGETLIAIFDMKTPSGERPVAIILLGSHDYVNEGTRLMTWLRTNYF